MALEPRALDAEHPKSAVYPEREEIQISGGELRSLDERLRY